ncbi:MAG: DNA metabolism protein [Clostridiales bacterium]|jgi:probable DNA metabolism protein|nr:DNA metabolism protein [Clostridiales bacterium]
MIYYIYDGSFEGMLTAVYESYIRHECPEKILKGDCLQDNLFVEYVFIDTDEQKAKTLYDAVKKKISPGAVKCILYAYLSEDKEAGTAVYQYLKLGWKMGKQVDSAIAHPWVFQIHTLYNKVRGEAGRMLGLIRFNLLRNGIYYASIEPDHNILSIIAHHFKQRMPRQDWIIHDVKRDLAAVCHDHQCIIIPFEFDGPLPLDQQEIDYQSLWKEYFKDIAIKSRINPKLQRQNMPLRYWKHLVEKPGAAKYFYPK